jgi:hypothetical protein
MRIAALKLLLQISSYSHPHGGFATPLPMDGPALLPVADRLRKASLSIFEDESEDSQLRALALRFLPIDQPEAATPSEPLASIRRVYARTHSDRVKYAVEDAFLTVSNDRYDSLHSAAGPVAGITFRASVWGCMKVARGGILVQSKYHELKGLPDRLSVQDTLVLTNVSTRERTVIQNARFISRMVTESYGESTLEVLPPPGLMPGVYSLGTEYRAHERLLSTGYPFTVTVARSAAGQVSFQ